MPPAINAGHPANTACNWKLWSTLQVMSALKQLKFSCLIKDQGWGNLKGQIELKLCRGPRVNHAECNEWNQSGSGDFSHVLMRKIIANADHQERRVDITLEGEIVTMAQKGDYYELHYKIGGGGGHHL